MYISYILCVPFFINMLVWNYVEVFENIFKIRIDLEEFLLKVEIKVSPLLIPIII